MAPTIGFDSGATAMAPAVESAEDAETGPVRLLAAAEVILGVAVAGSVARLAFVGPAAGGYAAIKHSVVDLAINPFQTLTRAVTDAQQALADEGASTGGNPSVLAESCSGTSV